jgi:formate dehydrogenase iron-sulfur subunit
MVYVATGRMWWRARSVVPKFLGSTAVCGLATVLFTIVATSAVLGGRAAAAALVDVARPVSIALIVVVALKLVGEGSVFRHLLADGSGDLKRTAMLLSGDLRRWTWARFGAGIAGGLILPSAVFGVMGSAGPSSALCTIIAGAALLAVVAGELAERSLFFKALASPRMPGDLA